MRRAQLQEELAICHTVIRAFEQKFKRQEEDIKVLNESLNIVTEERDKLKAIVEGAKD